MKLIRSLNIAVIMIACLLSGAVQAKETFFDTRKDENFSDATKPLQHFLSQKWNKNDGRGLQHFCIVGINDVSVTEMQPKGVPYQSVWIHWREGNQLILWERASPERQEYADSITHSRRQLDLKKDVVATEADIGGSTYLVTRAWVDKKIADCKAHGASYVIKRR